MFERKGPCSCCASSSSGLSVQLLFFPDSVTDDEEEEEDPAAKGPQLPKVSCGCGHWYGWAHVRSAASLIRTLWRFVVVLTAGRMCA